MGASHRVHARTDIGRVREHNEDCFYVDAARGLYVVADGMGGHAAGEVASALAVQTVAAHLDGVSAALDDFLSRNDAEAAEAVRAALSAAVVRANTAVYESAQADPERRGMGTTLTALLLLGRRAFIAHVGDSRLYLLRSGELRQLTEDHTVVGELRRRGRLRPEILATVANRNAVTRAVGIFENVEVDSAQVLAAPGDRFVLCSDGLHRYFRGDVEVAPLFGDLSEEACSHRLMAFALERGGADNVTVVVVTLPDEQARAQVVRELARSYETLSSLPFFRQLSPRELMMLQAMSRVRECGPGEEIVREGEEGDSMFVLLEGACSVRKGDVEIARLASGEHLGEMALVERGRRTATVVADDEARLLELSRDDLFGLLREQKDTGMKLLWNIVTVLTARLRETSRELGEAREALVAEDFTAQLFIDELGDESPARRSVPAPADGGER